DGLVQSKPAPGGEFRIQRITDQRVREGIPDLAFGAREQAGVDRLVEPIEYLSHGAWQDGGDDVWRGLRTDHRRDFERLLTWPRQPGHAPRDHIADTLRHVPSGVERTPSTLRLRIEQAAELRDEERVATRAFMQRSYRLRLHPPAAHRCQMDCNIFRAEAAQLHPGR